MTTAAWKSMPKVDQGLPCRFCGLLSSSSFLASGTWERQEGTCDGVEQCEEHWCD